MNLRDFCKSKGTNIKQVAQKMNVAPSTLYAISRGDTSLDNVGVSLFISLAQTLECTTDELYDVLSGCACCEKVEQLEPHEKEIVDIMRSITKEGQQQLLIFARGVKESYSQNHQLRENKTA